MIVVKLMGGLGNHLFQYAVGRRLAEAHRTTLKMDISFFDTYDLHSYSIGPFKIKENFASPRDTRELKYGRQAILGRVVRRAIGRSRGFAPTYVHEQGFQFDPEILKLPDGVYLEGYWQSEKYFSDIAKEIRREFCVKTEACGKDKELGEIMASCEAVSIHVRRGSYLKPPYDQVHGTCPLDYYARCVDLLCERVSEPHFFVFSDDPQWAKDHLKLPNLATMVDHNGADKDYEDLRLMTQCKHHIIANSTFSWWGAWLRQARGGEVFAPRRWFASGGPNTDDLIPTGWVRV